MQYDLIIGNPPYKRDLHLKILDKCYSHLKENGQLVWFAPIVRLVSPRTIFDERAIKKFNEYKHIWNNIRYLEEYDSKQMYELFNVLPQNKIGMIKVIKDSEREKEDIKPSKFIQMPEYLEDIVRRIMADCMKNCFLTHPDNREDAE